MKKLVLFSVLLSVIALTSCRKDRFEPTTPGSMEELKVPANFDWKTTKDYTITFTAASAGMIEVANSNGIAYQRAFLAAGTPYGMKLTLPTFEKTVKLKYQGKTADLSLTGTNLTYQFN